MYTEKFKKLTDFLLIIEGKYTNNKNDSGGPTNFGITQFVYNNYLTKNNLNLQCVKYITKSEVFEIYFNSYYSKLNIEDLDDSISYIIYDFSVNSGINRALKLKEIKPFKDWDVIELLNYRFNYYSKISSDKNIVFLSGWLNRLNKIAKHFNIDWRCENK